MFIWPRVFCNSLCNLLFEIFITIPYLNRRVVYGPMAILKWWSWNKNLYHFVRPSATFHYKVTVFPLMAEDNRSKLGGWRVKWRCMHVLCVYNKHTLIWQEKGRKNSFHSMKSDVSSGCLPLPRSNSQLFVRNCVCSMAMWKDSKDLYG